MVGVAAVRVTNGCDAEPYTVLVGGSVAQCHQGVDVLPPPIVQRKSCACGSVVVSVKGRVGGGVKVVVKVDAV